MEPLILLNLFRRCLHQSRPNAEWRAEDVSAVHAQNMLTWKWPTLIFELSFALFVWKFSCLTDKWNNQAFPMDTLQADLVYDSESSHLLLLTIIIHFLHQTKCFLLTSAADRFSRYGENTSALSQSAPCALLHKMCRTLEIIEEPLCQCLGCKLWLRGQEEVQLSVWTGKKRKNVLWKSSTQRAIRYKFTVSK